jgi:N-acetyl sugar amidotransferase
LFLGKVSYCKKCVLPTASAIPIEIDEYGICSACQTSEEVNDIDWDKRMLRLKKLIKQYQSDDGSNYDCIIPVSGGKDSYFQIHIIKNILGFNPLLVTYNANNWTREGHENLYNMRDAFGCDHHFITPSIDLIKRLNRLCFKKMGDMNWHGHSGIFTVPFIVAVNYNVPLLFYGEHGFMDLGGMHSYNDYVEFTQRYRLEHILRGYDWHDMVGDEDESIERHEMLNYIFPKDEDIRRVGVRGIFLQNYVRWSGNDNAIIAKKYGWKESEQPFERTYRKVSNLDDMHENGIHDYLKYIKFGYGRATDHVCKDIREGRMTRNEGIEIVRKMDHIKSRDLDRWLKYVGMDEEEFDRVADTFRDPTVWEKDENGNWVKDNIWEQN